MDSETVKITTVYPARRLKFTTIKKEQETPWANETDRAGSSGVRALGSGSPKFRAPDPGGCPRASGQAAGGC